MQSGSALARRGRTRSTVVQLPAAARGAARGLAACDGSTPIMDYGRVSRTYARRVLQVCIICTSRRRALRRSRASRAAAVVSTYVAASSDLGRRAASRRSGERQGSVVGGGAKVGQAQADGELGSPCAPRWELGAEASEGRQSAEGRQLSLLSVGRREFGGAAA